MRYEKKIKTFCDFAFSIAELSTCKRMKVGCTIFPFDCSAIYALGYNGPARGIPNDACRNIPAACGCAHAEANAIAKLEIRRPSILFTTLSPCIACANSIINAGCIEVVIYSEIYRSSDGLDLLELAEIQRINYNADDFEIRISDLYRAKFE